MQMSDSRDGNVRWFTPDESRAWRTFVAAHGRLLGHIDAALVADTSVSLAEYEVLGRLSESPDWRMRMNELADGCGLSPSGLTRRFDSMVRDGLVDRARCDADRRGVFAVLLPKGHELLVQATPTHVANVRRFFLDVLGQDELTTIVAALQRVGVESADGSAIGSANTGRVAAVAQR